MQGKFSDLLCKRLFLVPSVPAFSYRRRVSLLEELSLVPIGISRRLFAGFIQRGHLIRGEIPADRCQVLAQLLLIAGTDDD